MSLRPRHVQRLPSTLVDQIAAGEVVERPASVVKELVENALDAGCTQVRVEIDQGGLARILVSDDGHGMEPADAKLAIERHATSKIARFEELTTLRTFGFRGEALPSTASVSRFTLTTRTRESDAAFRLEIVGGQVVSEGPIGAAWGTTITVSDLFFNVPARRKFLKTTATEASHVSEVVHLAALAHPSVKFTLFKDGKLVREYLRANSLAERAREAHPGERLLPLVSGAGNVTFHAWLSLPERARAGMTGLYLFVLGRPVRDRMLARAVAQGYGALLPAGRYPIGVFFLDVPPDTLDINVHPQKAEVRFSDGRAVFEAVTRGVRQALAPSFALPLGGAPTVADARTFSATSFGGRPLLPRKDDDEHGARALGKKQEFVSLQTFFVPPTGLREVPTAYIPNGKLEGPVSLRDDEASVSLRDDEASVSLRNDEASVSLRNDEASVSLRNDEAPRARPALEEEASLSLRDVVPIERGEVELPSGKSASEVAVPDPPTSGVPPFAVPLPESGVPSPRTLFGASKIYGNFRYLGPLHGKWLLCEGADGLHVLDAHAATERALFLPTKRAVLGGTFTRIPASPLAFPLDERRLGASFDALCAFMSALGFEIRRLGPRSAAAVTVPPGVTVDAPFLSALADVCLRGGPATGGPPSMGDVLENALPTLVCRLASFDDVPPPDRIREILDLLDTADFKAPCVHGRPLVTRLGFDELERKSR